MYCKRSLSLLISAYTALILAGKSSAQSPIRIMPLGDSITYGSGSAGGYRDPLYHALTALGYNVDFVGTQTSNPDTTLPDSDHEGHSGWTIGGIDGSIIGFLDAVDDPDVVLLHIGTNDSGAGDFNNRIDALDNLVTKIVTKRPFAHVIVTTLLKRGEPNYTAITNLFNPYVPGKVTGQQALGNRVTFLDMHAYLELTDMYDNLHPNQGGYDKMAAAWVPAITNVVSPTGDFEPPELAHALGGSLQQATVTFSKPVAEDTATNIANYALSGGLAVTGATLSTDQRTVTLTTDTQSVETTYTVTVNNVTDLSDPTPLTIAANSTVQFVASASRGYLNNIPESETAGYQVVYAIDLPTTANYSSTDVPYSTDNTRHIGSFSRVAYYLELQKAGEPLRYLWVSMDAFTNRVDKLGLPTFASGVVYQQYVDSMNIFCNVAGVTTGTGITTGNIEFWPYNYSAGNAISIPNADGGTYDFGDTCSYSANYSCMQVHNHGASQVLFAINHWNGGPLQIGIGNNPSGHPDYTFSDNAGIYTVKTLQVLALRDSGDTTAPTPLSAQAGAARDLITVTFDEPLNGATVIPAHFSLNNGMSVLQATLRADQRTVDLLTTRQSAHVPLTLSIQGIRDTSPNANAIAAGTIIAVTPPALPPEIVSNIGTNAGEQAEGYQLVYTLEVPITSSFNSNPDFYLVNQSNLSATYDRIAYYMELQKPGSPVQYVWTSMDSFTSDPNKIGLPVNATGAVFQQYVSNLVVQSNVAGVSNGTAFASGNIEFWASNYSAGNAKNIPNASATEYDFGDDRGSNTGAGHGCMQVHNYLASQTVFAINKFGTDNNVIALGIGNNSASDRDWTHTSNANIYTRRILHVLVRPTPPPALPPEVEANVPQAESYQLAYTVDLPVNGDFWAKSPDYYLVNNYTNGSLPETFQRIAYYLELVPTGTTSTQFLWTAMDAFTTDARRIAVPTNGTHFRQYVNDLEVFSNVAGISNVTGAASGNIEFWPSNYGTGNDSNIPGASGSAFDFGDGGGNTGKGYGCMQVHNYGAQQTLFAINHFNDGNKLQIGIGNKPSSHPDYTFSDNADQYEYRRLHVLVLPGTKRDAVRPWVVNAAASHGLSQISVLFSETLADDAGTPSFYSLDNGATVTGAELLPDRKVVMLDTSTLTAGQTYKLTISHVRDASASANELPLYSIVNVTVPLPTLPDVLTNMTETAEYELIHQLTITDNVNYQYGCNYTVDQSFFTRTQAIDRIAYCMELENAGTGYHWVYVSMDAFTDDINKIGVPTVDRLTMWQKYVNNLNIYASDNIAGSVVTTGVGITSGNIEFWPSNYGANNSLNIPGALSSLNGTNVYDFGDGSANATSAGHGSMQVHNYLQGHTVFALNHFGRNGYRPCIGIGNDPAPPGNNNFYPDWTFRENANTYTTKKIYVLAKPGAPLPPPADTGIQPELWDQPRSLTILKGERAFFNVYAPDATAYQWRKNGQWIPGATSCCIAFDPSDLSDAGIYDVLVYGDGTAYTTSNSATLQVIPAGTLMIIR